MNTTAQPNTSPGYSPHDLLPAPEPSSITYPEGYFYHNVAKHLIKDTVRIMHNGLHIDMHKVEDLEVVLSDILTLVDSELASNPYVQAYIEQRYKRQIANYIEDRKSKMRTLDYYLVPFKHTDMVHRSYFMQEFTSKLGISQPTDLLPTGVPKWPVKLVRKFATKYPKLKRLLDGNLIDSDPTIKKALTKLASDKADMYNKKYIEQIHDPKLEIPAFNPNSSQQKRELFEMLDIESEATSKDTGLPSWDRDQIERVNKETLDEDVKHFTQQLIEHSFAAIVKNNFIKAFYNYTVDGRLHGSIKLFGAKSFRPTSQNPWRLISYTVFKPQLMIINKR